MPRAVGRAWIQVIDEGHVMANKDLVFNYHTFADKGVARNFAALADPGALLDFDEGADLGIIANLTSVKVCEPKDSNVLPQLYVGSD
jgi:hypothetical protein